MLFMHLALQDSFEAENEVCYVINFYYNNYNLFNYHHFTSQFTVSVISCVSYNYSGFVFRK